MDKHFLSVPLHLTSKTEALGSGKKETWRAQWINNQFISLEKQFYQGKYRMQFSRHSKEVFNIFVWQILSCIPHKRKWRKLEIIARGYL